MKIAHGLKLIAQYESFKDLLIDSAIIQEWFSRLLESEQRLIKKYQQVRIAQQDGILNAVDSVSKELDYDLPDFFKIELSEVLEVDLN